MAPSPFDPVYQAPSPATPGSSVPAVDTRVPGAPSQRAVPNPTYSVPADGVGGVSVPKGASAPVFTPPTPTPPPTPGSDEAVISPPVTTLRSTYALTDVGVIQRKPAGMPGFGPYWGNPPKNFTTGANDVANDPFWGPLGVKWTSYCSTDHDAEGGVYLSLSSNEDPKVLASWRTYDQALAAGVFASVATKPAGNPIFKHAAGASTETPQVIKIGDTWAMFYQTYAVNGAINQCTNRVLSTDGLNWTGTRTAPWLVFTGGESGQMGDGHDGYARIAPNPFPRSTAPFDWIISSLGGGTDRGMFAMWGTNDPINGAATFIQTISPQRGRLGMEAGLYCADLTTLGAVRQGIAALGSGLTTSGSGTAVQKGSLYELLFDPTGTEIIAAPSVVMPMPLNADVSDLAAIPAVITRDNERVVMFQGTRVPTDGSSKVNVTALAAGPRRNRQNTWFDPLSPAIPAALTVRALDFRTATALPASLTRYNNVASDVVSFEGADAGANGVGTGMTVAMTAGGTTRQELFYFEQVPATTEFLDLYLQDWRSRDAGANRRIGFGIRAAAAGTAWTDIASNDGLLVRNTGSGTDVFTGVKGARVGGVDALVNLESYPTLSTPSSKSYGRKNIGLRWYRSAGRAFLLGEGRLAFGVETEEIIVPDALKPGGANYGLPLNIWFGLQSLNNTANKEQIAQVRARWA